MLPSRELAGVGPGPFNPVAGPPLAGGLPCKCDWTTFSTASPRLPHSGPHDGPTTPESDVAACGPKRPPVVERRQNHLVRLGGLLAPSSSRHRPRSSRAVPQAPSSPARRKHESEGLVLCGQVSLPTLIGCAVPISAVSAISENLSADPRARASRETPVMPTIGTSRYADRFSLTSPTSPTSPTSATRPPP